MKCGTVIVVLALTAASAGAASTSGLGSLTGSFAFTGRSAVDPAPDEPRDTHMLVYLTGDSAKALWDHMKVEARDDLCGEPGGQVKVIGDMQCSESPDKHEYDCVFAIDVASQKIDGGWAC